MTEDIIVFYRGSQFNFENVNQIKIWNGASKYLEISYMQKHVLLTFKETFLFHNVNNL